MARAEFPRTLPPQFSSGILPKVHNKLCDAFQSGERDIYVHIPNNFESWQLYWRLVLLTLALRPSNDFVCFNKHITVVGMFGDRRRLRSDFYELAKCFDQNDDLFEQPKIRNDLNELAKCFDRDRIPSDDLYMRPGTTIRFYEDGQMQWSASKGSVLILDTRLFTDYHKNETYECVPMAPGQYCCIVSAALHCADKPRLLDEKKLCRSPILAKKHCPHYPDDMKPRVDTGVGIGKYISRSIARGLEYNSCIETHRRSMMKYQDDLDSNFRANMCRQWNGFK
jgi:hypothetical protein